MKFTTSTVLAGLAATAAADSWESWSSVDSTGTTLPVLTVTLCPSEVTDTVTKTKTVAAVTSEIYATTITVEAPKTKTVTVYADGETALGAWEEWKPSTSSSSSSASSITSTPAGCVPHVVTTTEIQSVKVANSTTTISKSTLFIGDGKSAKTTITVTATGSSSAWAYGAGSASTTASWDSWSSSASGSGNSGSGSGSGSKSGSGSGSGSDFNSAAAAASSDKIVATGADAFKWTVAPGPSVTSVSEAPVYTQSPDGNWGVGGNDGWDNWNGGSSVSSSAASSSSSGASNSGSGSGSNNGNGSGSNNGSGSGSGSGNGSGSGSGSGSGLGGNNSTSNGSGNGSGSGTGNGSGSGSNNGNGSGSGNGIGGNNGTFGGNGNGGGFGTDPFNGTTPIPGSPASNVTKPFPALKEAGCNSPSDRSAWCDGKNIQSDYYEDYDSQGHCTYELFITNTTINFDGDLRPALAVNGQVPGPVIECNWGDLVSVTVHNFLQDNGTAIHWHGVRQFASNDMDGVPGITECPLAPGESRTYTWRASSYGTSWYHSHWATQYGDGIYGPIVIHGPATANYDVDAGVVAVSDTFPTTAAQWNALIAHVGPLGTTNYLLNGHNTKADLSAGQHSLWKVQQGKKYLFRFLNAAAQNMFSVSVDSHTMTVIAADFVPIVPYQTTWLNIGIGQRYDVVIEMNQAVDSYFLRAVTQTQCPSTCNNTGLAQANGVIAYEGVQETPYLLPTSTVNGNVTIADFNICDDEPLASLVPAVTKTGGSSDVFKAQVSTIPAGGVNQIATNDDGTVFRWFINNGFIDMDYTQPTLKILADKQNISLASNAVILPDANVWVYFVIQNQFFASHPMHLHGHDFSLLGQGPGVFDETMVGTLNFQNPMRRDTAMLKGALNPFAGVPGYTVIGFETDNPGAWLMHCHIVWHVDGGLALEFLERPDDITADEYVNNGFNNKCNAYETYTNSAPFWQRPSWESGLKKRSTFFDEQVARLNMGQFDSVVRRADSPEKRYINSHALKRGIGHSRHFRR